MSSEEGLNSTGTGNNIASEEGLSSVKPAIELDIGSDHVFVVEVKKFKKQEKIKKHRCKSAQ